MTLSHLRTQIRWADSEISICRSLLAPLLPVTFWPLPPLVEQYTHAGALIDDIPDLQPLQDMPTDEDMHYWTHRDDEEDKTTVCAILDAEDPQEAIKRRLHCGGAYIEEKIDD